MDMQLTTRVKHIFRTNLFKAQALVQKNWLKLVIVLLAAFVFAHKDLNISLNLVKSGSMQAPPTQSATPVSDDGAPQPHSTNYTDTDGDQDSPAATKETSSHPPMSEMMKTSVVGAVHPTTSQPSANTPKSKPTTQKAKDDNLANTFSNIGFILNPTYAKRNNIDPAIVAQKRQICEAYVKRFAPFAVQEMKKYGIPASITLAQGLLESNAGASKLATNNKNHFGIKCFSKNCKKGHCTNYTDDSHKDFFRNYPSAKESYHAHSVFLQRSRYAHLKKLGTKNYKDWAHGLRKAGYATDPKYAPKLIKLIEVLKLHRYDK